MSEIAVSVTTTAVAAKYKGFDCIDSVEGDPTPDKMLIPGSLQVIVEGSVQVVSGPEESQTLTILNDGRVSARFGPGEWYCGDTYHGEWSEYRRTIK